MAEDDFIKRSKLAVIQKISGTHLWKSDDGFKAWETLCEVCESELSKTAVGYSVAVAPMNHHLRKHPCWLHVGRSATESHKSVGRRQNDTLATGGWLAKF